MEVALDRFPHPHLAVDVVLLTLREGRLSVLVLRREEEPFSGQWVLPGGFVRVDESVDRAAERVLREKAGLRDAFLEQLFTFGAVGRDPRGRVVSVAHYALIALERLGDVGPSSARRLADVSVPWSGLEGGPVELRDPDGSRLPVGFDHAAIVGTAVQRLRGKLDWAPVGFELLPEEFTLLQLQRVHEAILGRRLNKDSFRRRLLASGQIAPTGRSEKGVGHRPARMFRFRRARGRSGTRRR